METIRSDSSLITLINTFFVSPQRTDDLVRVLTEATQEVMRRQPGFVSANLHVSLDRGRVVNYAQWRSKDDFEAMQTNPEVTPHMQRAAEIAERFDPVLYAVTYVDDNPTGA